MLRLSSGLVRRPGHTKWIIFGTVAVGTFVSVMDQSGVNVALPRIADQFAASIPSVQWVSLGYVLVTGSLLLPMGRLSDMFGRKRVYTLGFAIFTLAAVLAGSSNAILGLILFKLLQGVGAAMIQSNGIAILASVFPTSERGKVLGLFMTVVGVGAIAGPVVGGLIVSGLGWRFVFFLGAPFGVVSILAALAFLERDAPSGTDRASKRIGFDWPGAGLSSAALALFLLAMTNAYRLGWSSPLIVAAFVVVAVLVFAFVWWEKRVAEPMLALELFSRRLFSTGSLAAFLVFFSGSSVFFLMPFYLQKVLGYTPGQAGLLMAPSPLAFALVGPIAGGLSDRFGTRWFAVLGVAIYASALAVLTQLTETASVGLVVLALALQGVGMGAFYSPNTASVLSTVEQSRYGIASAFVNMVRNLGNVTGIGVATAIVTATMASAGYEPSLGAVTGTGIDDGVLGAFTRGLRTAFLVMAFAVGAAMLLSLVKPGRAADVLAPEGGGQVASKP